MEKWPAQIGTLYFDHYINGKLPAQIGALYFDVTT